MPSFFGNKLSFVIFQAAFFFFVHVHVHHVHHVHRQTKNFAKFSFSIDLFLKRFNIFPYQFFNFDRLSELKF